MKTQLDSILSKEMDRKDFLRHIGVAMLMLAGGGMIMQALGSLHSSKPSSSERSSSYGYGSSSYGGR